MTPLLLCFTVANSVLMKCFKNTAPLWLVNPRLFLIGSKSSWLVRIGQEWARMVNIVPDWSRFFLTGTEYPWLVQNCSWLVQIVLDCSECPWLVQNVCLVHIVLICPNFPDWSRLFLIGPDSFSLVQIVSETVQNCSWFSSQFGYRAVVKLPIVFYK